MCQADVSNEVCIAAGSEDGTINIWNLTSWEKITSFRGHSGAVTGLSACRLGTRSLLAYGGGRVIRIWDFKTARDVGILQGHDDLVTSTCTLALDGRILLASSSSDRTIRVWDLEDQTLMVTLQGHTDVVNSVIAVEVSGNFFLASASYDKTVSLWDPITGKRTLTVHLDSQARTLCSAGRNLFVGMADGLLALRIGN